jgi:Domain of unknown function (DUF6265)
VTRNARITIASLAVLAFAAPAARAGQLDSLRFMAGSWAGGGDSDREEEHWTAPRGGLMVGMHRDLRGGKAKSFEFFRIEEREDGLWYLTQPGGQAATPFKAKEVSADRVVFENLEHDFPQRILYWRARPGELRARIEGTVKGKLQGAEWTWTTSALDR